MYIYLHFNLQNIFFLSLEKYCMRIFQKYIRCQQNQN